MNILFRNSRIKLPQGVLFWREIGTGIPVIFLHGSWDDGSQWIKLMELLSKDINCLTPDLLGFGESSDPSIHYSIDLQVECLANFLQALKLEKVYLVGNCLGGWIASSYALKYPESVYGMILLSPQGVAVKGEDKFWQHLRLLWNIPRFLLILIKLFTPFLKLIGCYEQINDNLQLRKTLLQYPVACQLLFNRHQPEIAAELLDHKLSNLQVPCLILQSGQDAEITIAKSTKFAQLIPDVQFRIIPDAQSNLAQFSVDIVAQELKDFITIVNQRIL